MNTLLAVDTNFLMDLARPRDVALDALEIIRRRVRGLQILVTPTVFGEITDLAVDERAPATRVCARKAISSMRVWDMFPIETTDLQATIAGFAANKLITQGVIPLEERNDALIIAEAAVLDCQVLVSSDSHLRDADLARMALVLRECQLPMVVISKPDEIVRQFSGR